MFWKRWAYRTTLGVFLTLGSFNPAGAAESDTARLIELLKSKNIITQPEADQLLKEVKESAKKEQKEKEEIRAAANKGGALPAALQGFKFSTTIFAEWNNKVIDNGPSLNQFNLNRAYFTLTKDINDWLGMNVTADLFTSKDANDKGNGLELRLKYGYASLKLFGTYSELGMIHTPSNYYDNSIWPYRVQGKNLLPDLGGSRILRILALPTRVSSAAIWTKIT